MKKIYACRSPLSNGIGILDYVFLSIVPENDGLIISTLYVKGASNVICHDNEISSFDMYLDFLFKGWHIMSKNDIIVTFGNIL